MAVERDQARRFGLLADVLGEALFELVDSGGYEAERRVRESSGMVLRQRLLVLYLSILKELTVLGSVLNTIIVRHRVAETSSGGRRSLQQCHVLPTAFISDEARCDSISS